MTSHTVKQYYIFSNVLKGSSQWYICVHTYNNSRAASAASVVVAVATLVGVAVQVAVVVVVAVVVAVVVVAVEVVAVVEVVVVLPKTGDNSREKY